MASGTKSSTDVTALNQRVKELEKQVSDYRRRLDELRKAKNTTLVKTQKEMVEVNTPQLGVKSNASDSKVQMLQKQLADQEKRHETEMSKLRGKVSQDSATAGCDHVPEIARLHGTIQSLEGENGALIAQNEELAQRVSSLMNQLSVKEATKCDNEEQYKAQVKKEWADKYKEWMEQTEKKIEELQQTNILLQGYLRRSGNMPDVP